MRILIILCVFFASFYSQAQELNAVVIINAEQTGKADLQVFKTLERSLTEFINTRRWTDRNFKQQERIDCSFNIIVFLSRFQVAPGPRTSTVWSTPTTSASSWRRSSTTRDTSPSGGRRNLPTMWDFQRDK